MATFEEEVTEIFNEFEKKYEEIIKKEYERLKNTGLTADEARDLLVQKSNKVNKKIRG